MTEIQRKTFAALLSVVLACLIIAPTVAFAEERNVEIENYTVAQDWKAAVDGIRIDGVDAPVAGKPLDGKAHVATAEGPEWEIPTLWVRDDLAWLVDLIINRLEPQAVNLLIDRFPAFSAATDKGASSSGSSDDYSGDKASLTFVANYLDCLNLIKPCIHGATRSISQTDSVATRSFSPKPAPCPATWQPGCL